jgi:peptide/nickel transport system substrate-binding protein
VAQLIMPGLITFDDHSEAVPDLAQSFRRVDPLTLEVKLRPHLTFHDGSVLDARAVKAEYDALISGAFPSPRADKVRTIARVEVVDPLTLRFHLHHPDAPLLADLSLGLVPLARATLPEGKKQDRSPIGAGPFRFVGQEDEDHLELAAFDGYYGGKPKVSRVFLRVVRDQTTRVLELLKGRADLTVNTVSPAVLPVLDRSEHLRVLEQPGTGFSYVAFNLRMEKLQDVRVRRAICEAIDVGPILDHKFHGLAIPATGMLPHDHWAYAAEPGCRHDLADAKRLLDQAGYPDPDGDGPRPRMTLAYKTSTDRFRRAIALVFKEQLSKVGIEVELRSLEFGTFYNDVRHGNFELFSMKWAAVVEPDLMRYVFGSEFVPTKENGYGGFNREAYKNPALDVLLTRAEQADRDERKTLYAQVQTILSRDLPYLPLWHESSVAIASDRLLDYKPSAHGFLRPLAQAREVAR